MSFLGTHINYPVLKHGPRSLSYAWARNFWFDAKEIDLQQSNPLGGFFFLFARMHMTGPERWWTIPEQDEAIGNCGGSPKWFWRANRSYDSGI